MNEAVVSLEKVRKVYRLYDRPRDRFLDAFGLLPRKQQNVNHHVALDGVDLTIRKAEKVAVIGRNGAGKSTLLKLISGVSAPTSGHIHVVGKVRALLQVGAGFHPEFTGRQNVEAYLAQFGINDPLLIAEIVEFAELEEYIDQPLRTYSTGMAMRLMFSASTALAPEILLLDEVLNVGDAYFAQKSMERIERLVSARQSTLILVTHDIYAATKICDRFVWIDKGQVSLDGDANTVIARYEVFNRDQSEKRLRQRRLKAMVGDNRADNFGQHAITGVPRAEAPEKLAGKSVFFGHIKSEDGRPIRRSMPIASISVLNPASLAGELFPGREENPGPMSLYLHETEHNWSEAVEVDGKLVRHFQPWGSIYHSAPFFVTGFECDGDDALDSIEIEISFKDVVAEPCVIEMFDFQNNRKWQARLGNADSGEWVTRRMTLSRRSQVNPLPTGLQRYGSQDMVIDDVKVLDRDGREGLVFQIGDPLHMKMRYLINRPTFDQKPVIHISFLRDGTQRVMRFILNSRRFAYQHRASGVLDLSIDNLMLGPGRYMINIVVMSEGGYEPDAAKLFFTVNPLILDHHSRGYEIEVMPSGDVLMDDVATYHPGLWSIDGTTTESSLPAGFSDGDDE